MSDASKLLDTIIKAPLWFFFAAMVATVVPMLNLHFLVSAGVSSSMTIMRLPLAWLAIVSTALFVSSSLARSLPALRSGCVELYLRTQWLLRLNATSDTARALLFVLDDEAQNWIYYDPRAPELEILRDRGWLKAQLVGDGGTGWGHYDVDSAFRLACRDYPGMMRRQLRRADEKSISEVRRKIASASKRANSTSRI